MYKYISVATGGKGGSCPPTRPMLGHGIRANPMSFFGGVPYVDTYFTFENPLSISKVRFHFEGITKKQIVLYIKFSEITQKRPMFFSS